MGQLWWSILVGMVELGQRVYFHVNMTTSTPSIPCNFICFYQVSRENNPTEKDGMTGKEIHTCQIHSLSSRYGKELHNYNCQWTISVVLNVWKYILKNRGRYLTYWWHVIVDSYIGRLLLIENSWFSFPLI